MKYFSCILFASLMVFAVGCAEKVISPSQFTHGNQVEKLVKSDSISGQGHWVTWRDMKNCLVHEVCYPTSLIFYQDAYGNISLEYRYTMGAKIDISAACRGGGAVWPSYSGRVLADVSFSGGKVYFSNVTDKHERENEPDTFFGGLELKKRIEKASGSAIK